MGHVNPMTLSIYCAESVGAVGFRNVATDVQGVQLSGRWKNSLGYPVCG